ncbi:hypothetical protein PIB30_010256 [Stylosanthes scabra]|uniref:Uncharacterized protein n=1 Tax=Stylosanthes scabra TaxID=79078 RepID=A0ABU6S5W9_9FABA|nr:hypothetical protein [Stylosanthes scabra]
MVIYADIFESLTNNKVKFREAYGSDVKGLIALHEAAQLSIGEEDATLEDAGLLSRELLHSWLPSRHQGHHHNHDDEAQYVASSLQQPLHHNLTRFMDKTILLRNFKADDKEAMCFMELAEINSSIVRIMNQHEGLQVSKAGWDFKTATLGGSGRASPLTLLFQDIPDRFLIGIYFLHRWWNGEAMLKEPQFAGYEALKWYMWSMTCFTDPRFSEQRVELTKCISLVYVIDDIFDVYGTLGHLVLFTDAVKRWELVGTEQLPEFMKVCLRALYQITNDFAHKVYKKHGLNPIDTVKNSWIRLSNAFLEETRWLSCGELPKAEEYLKHAVVTTGVHVALVHAFFLFDQNITKETVAILDEFPTIIYSVAKILRLSDDLEGHKNNKNERGFDGSYIECYMREHQQVSAEDAERHVEELISMEWKNLNRQVLGCTDHQQQFPSSFTKFCLNAARMDILYAKEAVLLKEAKHVMNKLINEDPMESLCMVDFIQRLGIDHHFQDHIEAALEKQHFIVSRDPIHFVQTHQLYKLALSFRLLRQGGYSVNADIFESLTNNKVQFREAYGEDVKGLIALHEAAQLSIGEEDTTLEDAGLLSRELLHSWLSRHQGHHHQHEAQYVASCLQQPLHHNLTRFMDKTILLSNSKPSKEAMCFMELAEINSCILRLMNQHEGLQVSKWWNGQAMSKEPKFAGYEALKIKWYMWSMACFTDPSFSDQRLELSKPISLVYIIDDIYDVYGTLDQLVLFTDAVKRWELTGTEYLPKFMRNCLSSLYEVTNAFAEKIYKKHGLNPINTLKKSWMQLLNASLEGARWSDSGELPKAEEYLKHATVSTGVHVVLVHSFFLFHQNITKETLAILEDIPDIIYSVAKILRLCDDLEGHKKKNQSGFDGSYLECYMREHQEVSAEDAERHVEELISMEWKLLNRQVLGTDQQQFPSAFTKFCLNAARMVPLMYHYRSNPSLSNLHQHVKSIANVGAAHM